MNSDNDYMKIKPPTTYREQVEIFQKRNLHIENSEFAEKYLQRVNYYRLSAYAITFKDPLCKEHYTENSTFEKLTSLYEFDRRLRLLLLGVLETIEISFRTHISYEIAHKFGPLGYKDKENFIKEKYHKESLDELENLISRSRKGELFIEHHFKKYNGNIPIWAAIEVTSFGYISKLYRNLNEDLKRHIAKVYYNIPYLYLESWLQTLSNVRNVCAHYGRLYNKKLTFRPRLFKEDLKRFNNQKIYAAIYIIQRLLTREESRRFIIDLEALILEYDENIDFLHIGFPTNWKENLIHQE
ncbi:MULTISPECIES: Abi family protein [Bacillaceae]|uniref:Abi family protein n=1 Tax=Bacillaceae TaxID=186817 RepID=UPI000BFD5131|nr:MULTISPECIES: Abi family protein [Bacillaceae]MCM3164127.1 Abi family protein [Metabacillus litoralis]PGT84065.1 DNA-binding protein [Bacillus sp. AFS040349]UGB33770.1 Abi family protein [Metabacillus sp. B2-18]